MAPTHKKYSKENLLRAIAEVKNGSSTYRAASVKYGIPIATICDKVKNRMPVSTKLGRQHFLSHGQEDSLQQYMVTMGKIGYGVTKQDLPFIVKSVLDEAEKEGLTNAEQRVFTNNLPSKGWTYSFLKRHPNLNAQTPENLGFQRAYVNEQTIGQWFNGLQKFLSEEYGLDAKTFLSAKNGSRIFNVDESGFPLQETTGKCQVITERSTKNVHRLAPDTRQQITVLSCVSASGDFMKPFVLFPGKKWPKFNLTGVNEDDYDLGHTENGWISTDTFFDWISNLFYPYMKDRVPFPILLFMDGHTAHINIAVSDFCKDHEIILYCFPPHASHILQPLDVSVFGPLKKGWNRSIKDFYLNNRVQMTKTHFFQVFDVAWKEARGKPNNVVSGFRAAGLVPFNVEHVDFSKLLDTKSVEKFKKGNSSHAPSLEESLGLTRALSIVEKNLSTAELTLFKKRYDEGYDLEDGPLWKIYKGIQEALSEEKAVLQIDQTDEDIAVATIEVLATSDVSPSNETVCVLTLDNNVEVFEDGDQSAAGVPRPSRSSMIRRATFTDDQSLAKKIDASINNNSLTSALHSTRKKVTQVKETIGSEMDEPEAKKLRSEADSFLQEAPLDPSDLEVKSDPPDVLETLYIKSEAPETEAVKLKEEPEGYDQELQDASSEGERETTIEVEAFSVKEEATGSSNSRDSDTHDSSSTGLKVSRNSSKISRKFLCELCDHTTTREIYLKKHMLTKHKTENFFKCKLCDYSSAQSKDLKIHLFTNHEVAEKIRCEFCYYSSSNRGDVNKHTVAMHRGNKPLRCDLCDYSCVRKADLRMHLVTKHGIGEPFKCDLCSYSTARKGDLKKHLVHRHGIGHMIKCDFCSYAGSDMSQLKRHLIAKHGVGESHSCELCDYACRGSSLLERHLFEKHGIGEPLKCEYCDYSSADKNAFEKHNVTEHGGGQLIKCELCDYSDVEQSKVKEHFVPQHYTNGTYECDHCEYTCTRKYMLKQHLIAIHSLGEPFRCEVCEYTCAQRKLLRRHMANKHGIRESVK